MARIVEEILRDEAIERVDKAFGQFKEWIEDGKKSVTDPKEAYFKDMAMRVEIFKAVNLLWLIDPPSKTRLSASMKKEAPKLHKVFFGKSGWFNL